MNNPIDTRPSPIAGQWYPSDAAKLSSQVDEYIDAAGTPEFRGDVVAIMAPHAGHRYSGPVAGYAFSAFRGLAPETVAVVSPMHHPYFEPLLTTSHSAYETPLGKIPVDPLALDELDEQLRQKLGFGLKRIPRDPEHSLEIELPFLQCVLKNPFSLLPVMVRDQSANTAHALGEAMANVLKERNALFVASTDLSHFYPQNLAEILDARVLEKVEAFDPQGVIQIEEEGKGFACGRGALAAVLWAAQELGADRVKILNYATSGDITGDFSQVVGYGAAVITRPRDISINNA